MVDIVVVRNAPEDELTRRGVRSWPIWTKEISVFPWSYDQPEVCYFLEGDVVVTPKGGEGVRIGKGDLVTFPRGLDCTWEVRAPVRKHYNFG